MMSEIKITATQFEEMAKDAMAKNPEFTKEKIKQKETVMDFINKQQADKESRVAQVFDLEQPPAFKQIDLPKVDNAQNVAKDQVAGIMDLYH